jgi:alanyl-tRNA synthetase
MPEPPRTSDEIRAAYLAFFQQRGHQLLPPWPLVPIGDPTSLFTSAGMQQFKPIFAGEQERPSPRATTVQRCFRTTDIEEVGDYSHCTAFEMLGNFSFGDYFKREAIQFAWELLTDVYQIPPERLHVTIFLTDDEAYGHWREVGVPDERIHRRDEELNYWFSFPKDAPGASGPCGPDSEIYYDYFPERGAEGAQLQRDASGEPIGGVGYDDDRFVEIWNLVFMQLFQHPDGSRTDLPAKNIDTGSGLERVAAALQGKRSVFETDIFLPILETAARVAGVDYFSADVAEDEAYAVRAISEHCRAATLLIGDGVAPSNEGRGYVLRRVIRRAIYFGRKIGIREPFTVKLADAAIEKLKVGYPHLLDQQDFIRKALDTEERRFLRTLEAGTQRIEALLTRLRAAGATIVPGDEAFLLYDTFGMPVELTREIAASEGFALDDAGFDAAMEDQRRRARAQGRLVAAGADDGAMATISPEHSDFVGYTNLDADAHVAAIVKAGVIVDAAVAGEACELILSITPFYPEGGGQVGDHGNIATTNGVFTVEDTQARGGAIVHRGHVTEGEIRVADSAAASVDIAYRRGAARNHTGTHILHAALRSILGTHVRQQGSLVTPDRLRFDFTHLEQTPRSVLLEAEAVANDKVRHDLAVNWRTSGYREAVEGGALAFFGDKYGAEVRVVEIRDDHELFSAELCGGTHVHRTGELGLLHILRESAVAAGTRRIEALTGVGAEHYFQEQQERLYRLAEQLGTSTSEIEDRVAALQSELERLRKQSAEFERLRGSSLAAGLIEGATKLGDVFIVAARVEASSSDALREVADRVRAKLQPAVVVLGADIDGRAALLVAATPDIVERGVKAGDIMRELAAFAGGKGGGRPDLAQGAAKDVSMLTDAIAEGGRLAAAAVHETTS